MFFMAIHYPESTLKILDYNRVLKTLNGMTNEEFIANVGESYDVQPLEDGVDNRPTQKGDASLYIDNHWYRLRVK